MQPCYPSSRHRRHFWEFKFSTGGARVGRMVSKSAAKHPPPPPATAQFPLLSYRPNPQGRRAGGQLQSGSHAEPVPKEPESPGEFPLLASEPGKKPGAVSIWSVSIYFRFLVPPKGVESSGPFPFTKSTKGGSEQTHPARPLLQCHGSHHSQATGKRKRSWGTKAKARINTTGGETREAKMPRKES